MSSFPKANDGLLILPHLQVKNANAIGSPLTHGFPSITAFVGFMWALNRKFIDANIGLNLNGVGVICHAHSEQISPTYEGKLKCNVGRFHLARHPIKKGNGAASVIEEGRMHLEVSLIFDVNRVAGSSEEELFLQTEQAARDKLTSQIVEIVADMKIAGGTIWESPTAEFRALPESSEARANDFLQLRRKYLPGFALVSRHALLKTHLQELRRTQPSATVYDAWLDLSRFNYRAATVAAGEDIPPNGQVKWVNDRPKGSGWIVPISVGYAALSPLYAAGSVRNARDKTAPVRFVEALHSVGEWIAPHRLTDVEQLLWYPEYEPEKGLYRMINAYSSNIEE